MLRTVLVGILAAVTLVPACGGKGDTPAVAPGAMAGKVVELSGAVFATRDGQRRALVADAEVFENDHIETGADGQVVIVLGHNQARWELGANKAQAINTSTAWRLPRRTGSGVAGDEVTSAAGRHGEKSAATTAATASAPASAPDPSDDGADRASSGDGAATSDADAPARDTAAAARSEDANVQRDRVRGGGDATTERALGSSLERVEPQRDDREKTDAKRVDRVTRSSRPVAPAPAKPVVPGASASEVNKNTADVTIESSTSPTSGTSKDEVGTRGSLSAVPKQRATPEAMLGAAVEAHGAEVRRCFAAGSPRTKLLAVARDGVVAFEFEGPTPATAIASCVQRVAKKITLPRGTSARLRFSVAPPP